MLVTNLAVGVTARVGGDTSKGRWEIDGHYPTRTDLLHCEVPPPGDPRAALFAFSLSAVAGNALAVLQGDLRAAHGVEPAAEISDYALVNEVAEV